MSRNQAFTRKLSYKPSWNSEGIGLVTLTTKQIFSANLRQELLDKGLSKSEFARMLGVNPSLITHWTDGTHFPQAEQLDVIVRVLNTTLSHLTRLSAPSEPKISITPDEALKVIAEDYGYSIRKKRQAK